MACWCGESLRYCVLESHYESGRNAPKLWMLKLISFNVSFAILRFTIYHPIDDSLVYHHLPFCSVFFFFTCSLTLISFPSNYLCIARCLLQLNGCRWTHSGFTVVILEAISAKFNFNVIWLSQHNWLIDTQNHIIRSFGTHAYMCVYTQHTKVDIAKVDRAFCTFYGNQLPQDINGQDKRAIRLVPIANGECWALVPEWNRSSNILNQSFGPFGKSEHQTATNTILRIANGFRWKHNWNFTGFSTDVLINSGGKRNSIIGAIFTNRGNKWPEAAIGIYMTWQTNSTSL